MLEFQQFNMAWDRKMADYEQNAEDMVVSMRVRILLLRRINAMRCLSVGRSAFPHLDARRNQSQKATHVVSI